MSLQCYTSTKGIEQTRRLAIVKKQDREINLNDVPVGEDSCNLFQQVNAALAQSCQPFVTWRLEWVSDEVDRLWPDGVRRSATSTARLAQLVVTLRRTLATL